MSVSTEDRLAAIEGEVTKELKKYGCAMFLDARQLKLLALDLTGIVLEENRNVVKELQEDFTK